MIYRVAVIGSVVVLAFSVFVNAHGALLSSTICWNLKGSGLSSVDKDAARVWSWSNPQFDYGIRAIASEGLQVAITRCPLEPQFLDSCPWPLDRVFAGQWANTAVVSKFES